MARSAAILLIVGVLSAPLAAQATVKGALERVVTGVPFVADSVTEFIQTVSDGSHVRRTVTAVVARDSRGRTRYPLNLSPLIIGEPRTLTIVRDPVASVSYTMDSKELVARRENIRPQAPTTDDGSASASALSVATNIARQTLMSVLNARGNAAVAAGTRLIPASLADRTLDGLVVSGARMNATVGAGQIGNDRALTFAAEIWYSGDLRIVMVSTVSDPIAGDTIFRIANLRRSEPDASLFEIPSGYRVIGAGVSAERGRGRVEE